MRDSYLMQFGLSHLKILAFFANNVVYPDNFNFTDGYFHYNFETATNKIERHGNKSY